ncbi:hypothetical protein [Chryseobacterium sp. Leaf394]|uniref:hypothetical protein n=1 Tax=Chryseobacterium sp. Leaf394 TaxID=1736361 RepID=UPI000FF8B062|nr:hypothetical protein [Chryseobacterium sp. Leaf394]
MKKYLFLILLSGLSYSQDQKQISDFINQMYGNGYYFLENKSKTSLIEEFDKDWENILSEDERKKYNSQIRIQNEKYVNWLDFQLKKAIICENGRPIVNETNIPFETVLFIPKGLEKKERQKITDESGQNRFIIYSKKSWNDSRKKAAYLSFLNNFQKNYRGKDFNVISLSKPIFFGDKRVLLSSFSKFRRSACLLKETSGSNFEEVDCLIINVD